jgi:lipopolysaccharide transport system ATP-binding protein
MSETVIAVEGLSKRYLIGHQSADRERYVALRDVIGREVHNFFRRTSDIVHGRQIVQGDEVEEFMALKEVSFEVKRGEVLGIIGRNGAGKSTLLKIISRITEPTAGRVHLRGRVASLLEVGTGFHPELSGRENIFLNGAVLGMTRAEIKRKFDEIVAFAEVEKFIETPVKRYSSGMYVRLAFAVAAHLEPEILVVDEVLAVGDAEFQKKCLGKMGEVAGQGRTVLFVSHNLAAVKSLTSRVLVLDAGVVSYNGEVQGGIEAYSNMAPVSLGTRTSFGGSGVHTTIRSAQLLDDQGGVTTRYVPGQRLRIAVEFETDGTGSLSLEAFLLDAHKGKLGLASLYQFEGKALPVEKGIYNCIFELSSMDLASGPYSFDVSTSIANQQWDHYLETAIQFEVLFYNSSLTSWNFSQSHGYGPMALRLERDVVFTPKPDMRAEPGTAGAANEADRII